MDLILCGTTIKGIICDQAIFLSNFVSESSCHNDTLVPRVSSVFVKNNSSSPILACLMLVSFFYFEEGMGLDLGYGDAEWDINMPSTSSFRDITSYSDIMTISTSCLWPIRSHL